jgi:hypothetical protein
MPIPTVGPDLTKAIDDIALLGILIMGAWNTAKISRVGKTANAIHTLSNSAMGAQLQQKVDLLKALAVFAHRFADIGNDADKAAATALDVRVRSAEKDLQDHLVRQALVDAEAREN